MARVTVEDCIKVVPNRFELAAITVQRAKEIYAGAEITLERNNDKNIIIALREIAKGNVKPDVLKEKLINTNCHSNLIDKAPDDHIGSETSGNLVSDDISSATNTFFDSLGGGTEPLVSDDEDVSEDGSSE
ncbi:DNA-directed RNA polymerase subunit omega [Rickettsia endosymbiont of Cardiosporidium cionae]|uniref:DNA-directed RNA polymerase subunit omega n=1 Tax=Rickettsia endosymbiont of Cardiosporidium cionae TaxID=2777155 RepID=UPI00189448D0|nr:DNA-directed RNA polymerase subunit omega [Rickettsia endosymbiont of Cardiosporidium cionae]KAF8818472.1 DNA-directed RNA polymerase subunit omega [Rickettsia endosymbiont of Cardiosporidium cionae]